MQSVVKCLLVDDVEENLLALAALLQREDVQILTARSGLEALDLLLQHDVALALLDVQMPEMDGFELAELMRGSERTRHVPLIFVTARARDERRLFKGYDAGAVDFLHKPIEPRILENKAQTFFQLHRQKQQLAEELERRTETLRLNEMFTAVLGHDLRNPLNAIITSAYLLERQSREEAVHDTARRILSSGKRMSRMIEDMFDVSRARLAGGIPLQREPSDLLALIQRVVKEHQTACPERRIAVGHQGDFNGDWDAGRLAQAASNLIGNALQHGDGSAPIQVRVDGTRPDSVELSVINAGVIAPEIMARVFEPFHGGQPASGRREGLGLGLFIVQQIVQAHGGSVDVRSGEDGHTYIRVSVPRWSVATDDVIEARAGA
ncbi:MAG TPA: hybrid sensor histidine kinase/response regulator [Steroidobacteraceae bacterium]|jgi:signal transduction histidine kinase|nr:hybrid sensor histidine kinase/response regulator [Steroidobacteraceae bacterium]